MYLPAIPSALPDLQWPLNRMLTRAFAWKMPHWLESWNFAPSTVELNRLPPDPTAGLAPSGQPASVWAQGRACWALGSPQTFLPLSLSLLRPSRPKQLCNSCPGHQEKLPLHCKDGSETLLSKANCISVPDLFSVSTFFIVVFNSALGSTNGFSLLPYLTE